MTTADEFADEIVRAARAEVTAKDQQFFQRLNDVEREVFRTGAICGLTSTLKRLGINDGAALQRLLDAEETR